jgi:hypothetical protein
MNNDNQQNNQINSSDHNQKARSSFPNNNISNFINDQSNHYANGSMSCKDDSKSVNSLNIQIINNQTINNQHLNQFVLNQRKLCKRMQSTDRSTNFKRQCLTDDNNCLIHSNNLEMNDNSDDNDVKHLNKCRKRVKNKEKPSNTPLRLNRKKSSKIILNEDQERKRDVANKQERERMSRLNSALDHLRNLIQIRINKNVIRITSINHFAPNQQKQALSVDLMRFMNEDLSAEPNQINQISSLSHDFSNDSFSEVNSILRSNSDDQRKDKKLSKKATLKYSIEYIKILTRMLKGIYEYK